MKLTCGEACHPLEGPQAIEVFENPSISGGILEVFGEFLATTVRDSAVQGGKLPMAVEDFIGGHLACPSCRLKGGGAFLVHCGPFVIIWMAS